MIKGRPCRCEKAKAHRKSLLIWVPHITESSSGLFFVERKFGPVCTPNEVRTLLQSYGNIEFCYTASLVERTALNLGEGVIVQFKLYDDGQNAQSVSSSIQSFVFQADASKTFRNHDVWKLVAIAGMHSPVRGSFNHSIRTSPSATDSARAYLSRYETDRRSVFVGNLPVGATEDEIRKLFAAYGEIEEIIIRDSTSKFERKYTPLRFQNSLADQRHSLRATVLRLRPIQDRHGRFRHSWLPGKFSFARQKSLY